MKAYDLALREQVVSAFEAGLTCHEVARRFGLHVNSVRSYVRRKRDGESLAPRPHGGGRRPLLDEGAREILKRLRLEKPTVRGEDLISLFFEATGITLGLSTVYRELQKLGLASILVPRTKPPQPTRECSKEPARPHKCRQRNPVPGPGRDQAYPSDLTDAEWVLLEPLIPQAKMGGRPEEWPKREIVNAILYVLRSGCPWRMLPHDFPPYTTVYDYFRAWRDQGLWERINAALSKRLRVMIGRQANPTGAIVDSQSVKTTEKGGPEATTGPSDSRVVSVTSSSIPWGY